MSDDLVHSTDPEHVSGSMHAADASPPTSSPSYVAGSTVGLYNDTTDIALGWVTGTGGGISIRRGDHVYLAPSGVQKERIEPEHIFVLPFAQSSVPKPGSQRDFSRVPTKQVSIHVYKPDGRG